MPLRTRVSQVSLFIRSEKKSEFLKHNNMNTITIEGQLRTGFGKTATRQLRSQDLVPAVIYGGAQEINFAAPVAAFKNLVYTPSFQLAEVKIDGKTYKTILKDLQFDKVTDKLIHIDLLELVDDKKVIADIPLKFVGTSKGVKDGGKLVTKMKSLKVKTLPKYLKAQIEVPIDNLELNKIYHKGFLILYRVILDW